MEPDDCCPKRGTLTRTRVIASDAPLFPAGCFIVNLQILSPTTGTCRGTARRFPALGTLRTPRLGGPTRLRELGLEAIDLQGRYRTERDVARRRVCESMPYGAITTRYDTCNQAGAGRQSTLSNSGSSLSTS